LRHVFLVGIYAGDLILLAASVGYLQKMLHIWFVSGTKIDIVLDGKQPTLLLAKTYDITNEDLQI